MSTLTNLLSLDKAQLLKIKNPLVFRLLPLQWTSRANLKLKVKNLAFVRDVVILPLEIWDTNTVEREEENTKMIL